MIKLDYFLKELNQEFQLKYSNRNVKSHIASRGASLLRENKVIAGTGVIKKLEYSSYEHIFMHRGKHQINKIIEIPHYEKDLALFIYFTYPYSEIDYHFTLIKIIKTEELKKYDFVETGVEILYSGTTPTFKPIISHAIHFRNGPIRLSFLLDGIYLDKKGSSFLINTEKRFLKKNKKISTELKKNHVRYNPIFNKSRNYGYLGF